MDRDCRVHGGPAKCGHLPPAVRVVLIPWLSTSPASLHCHASARLPPLRSPHLPGVGGLLPAPAVVELPVPGQKNRAFFDCIFTLTVCPPAWREAKGGWGPWGGARRRGGGVRLGGAQPELLIPDFPEIKVCISCARAWR